MFEKMFDYWLAKYFLVMLKRGYNIDQMKIAGGLLMFDFGEAINDVALLEEIKRKIETTIELLGERNEQTI